MSKQPPSQTFVKLNDGTRIPSLGLGTYDNTDAAGWDAMKRLIKDKYYAHIDTASFYQNEAAIGDTLQALFKEGVKREDIYVTTKIFYDEIEDVEGALHKSLKALKLDYVDLYLIHWPVQAKGKGPNAKFIRIPLHHTWAKLEALVQKGLIKSIGVSNFNFQILNDLLSYAKIKPVCNQIELHPYLVQKDLVEWMKETGIVPVAYSPLAKGLGDGNHQVPLTDPVIKKIAEKHGKTVGQIVLAWHLARGHVVIPKSSKYERGVENSEALNIKLSVEEVEEINKLDRNYRVNDNKKWGGEWAKIPLWD